MSSDLTSLRNEAKRLRKNVSAKINRIAKSSGAQVGGSEFDPRRSAGIEDRYNRRQLNAYIQQMKPFLQRGQQFVPDRLNRPIPRGEFNVYKRRESEQNRAGEIHAASIGDLDTPLGLKVREVKSALPQGQGSAVYGPYQEFNRAPNEIESRSALAKLSNDMLKKTKAGYLEGQLNVGRNQLERALITLGETDEMERVKELSDYQFDALWFGTTYAETTFLRYGMQKSRGDDDDSSSKERWQDKVVENAADDAREFLDWAENLPIDRPEASQTIRGFKR